MNRILVAAMVAAAAVAASSCGDASIKVSPPLFVTDTLPANGATAPSVSLNVVAVAFSEAVDEGSLKDKIALAQVTSFTDTGAGTAVAISLESLSQDKLTAVYTIGAALNPGTYYRITVSKDGVKAVSGNAMAADVRHYFLTE